MTDASEPPPDAARSALPATSGRAAPASPRRVTSDELFGRAVEIEIDHRGVLYRLRLTSHGKLILTK